MLYALYNVFVLAFSFYCKTAHKHVNIRLKYFFTNSVLNIYQQEALCFAYVGTCRIIGQVINVLIVIRTGIR